MDKNNLDVLEIGKRIKECRTTLGLTQLELGEKIQVSRAVINYWENGSRDIKTRDIVLLADTLGVTTDYLLGRTGDPNPQPCAVDELGLSDKAIETIKRLNQKNDQLDGLKNLDKLLSLDNPEVVLYGLKVILFGKAGK